MNKKKKMKMDITGRIVEDTDNNEDDTMEQVD